jgi:hypothetical protein
MPATMYHTSMALKRPRYPMPAFIEEALLAADAMKVYRNRPDYQQNDYIGWITRGRLEATREQRLQQMLAELRAGNVYMKMSWNAKK